VQVMLYQLTSNVERLYTGQYQGQSKQVTLSKVG